MEQKLSDIYTEAQRDINEKWQTYMYSVKPKADELLRAYEDAKISGDKDLIKETGKEYGRFLREQTITNDRYKSMLASTTEQLTHVNETALAYINGEMPEMYSISYNQMKDDASYIKGYSFDLVDANTVRALAVDDSTLLPNKKINIAKDLRWNKKAINSQLMQGILQGESIDKIAARLQNVTDMNRNSAIRNARTMTTAAENKGRQDSYDQAAKDGVVIKKVWVSTSDDRTRESHAELDGEEVDVDEEFSNGLMYPADPSGEPCEVYNCRCTMKTKIVGFKRENGTISYIEDVKKEFDYLENKYEDDIKGMSASDVRDVFISKGSYVNDDVYIDALSESSKAIGEQKSIKDKIDDLTAELSKEKAEAKPRSEWTADDMMKSVLGKTPMIQSERSKELEKQIDELWKQYMHVSNDSSNLYDIVEKIDKKNFIIQIKKWDEPDLIKSNDDTFIGFNTTMRISSYDDDLSKGIGYIAEMSPREYLERCAYDIFGSTYESAILGADPSAVLKYAKQMSEGVQFDMGYLDYDFKKQEGRHRAMAAELLGIDKIPVYIRGKK